MDYSVPRELDDAVPCPHHGIKLYRSGIAGFDQAYYVSTAVCETPTPLVMPDGVTVGCWGWKVFAMPHGSTVIAYDYKEHRFWRWIADVNWSPVSFAPITTVRFVAIDASTILVVLKTVKHLALNVFTGMLTWNAFPTFTKCVSTFFTFDTEYMYVADGVLLLRENNRFYDVPYTCCDMALIDVHSGVILARDVNVPSFLDTVEVVPYKHVTKYCRADLDSPKNVKWSVTVPRLDLHCSFRWVWIAAVVNTQV
jgi:hypothetical protein